MENRDWLAKQFEEARGHLRAVAYRMLGSAGEAEDAVQETWIRLNRSESEKIENLEGWLTTVVARVCLDLLRSRKSRREDPMGKSDSSTGQEEPRNPEADLLVADSVGAALLVVLDALNPAERIAFVLHDLFHLPFGEIASILGQSEESARQLASRARKRVRGVSASREDREREREIVSAFWAASRDGDFAALIRLLHPEAVLRADDTAIRVAELNRAKGAPQFQREIKGANSVADTLKGRATGAQLAWVGESPGAIWMPGQKPVAAFRFEVKDSKIVAIDVIMNPPELGTLDIELIDTKNGGTS